MRQRLAAGVLLATVLALTTWTPKQTRADTATVKVDIQVNTQPAAAAADPCQGNAAEVCVSTDGGQTGDQAYVHFDLSSLPDGVSLTGATVKFVPSGDTLGNANSGNASLQACPLTQAIAANFSSSLTPAYDCKKGTSVGKLNGDGSWTFDLTPVIAAWQQTGYSGITVMPGQAATPSSVPAPLPAQPPAAWSVSFTKKSTVAQGLYLAAIPPADQAIFSAPPPPAPFKPVAPVASSTAAPAATPGPVRAPTTAPSLTLTQPVATGSWLIAAGILGLLAIAIFVGAAARTSWGRPLTWPTLGSSVSVAASRTAAPVVALSIAAAVSVGASGGMAVHTAPGHTTQGGASYTGGGGGGGPAAGTGPGASGAPAGAGGAAGATAYVPGHLNPSLPPVKVGFTFDNSSQQIAAMLGVNIPTQGDPTVQIQAMVDYANAHGGLAGHKIIPDVIQVNTDSTDTNQWNNACIQFTEDDHVFAVLGAAGNQIGPDACYAQHHTPYLTGDVVLGDTVDYRQWSPYVFLPFYAAEDQTMMAEIQGLQAQGYFNGGKIGMVVQDFPEYHRIMDSEVGPKLASLGYAPFSNPESNPDVVYVVDSNGPANADQVIQEIQQAAVKFRVDNVDHVLMMYPGGGGWLFFWEAAQQQQYYPRYGYSSVDEPYAIQESNSTQNGQNVGAQQFKNAVGIGYLPAVDTSHEPFPDNSQAALCLQIMKAAGQTFAGPVNAAGAFGYCSATLLLMAAAAKVEPNLTQDAEAGAILGLGPYQMAPSLPGGSGWSPGRPESATGYRLSHFDSGCNCFLYTSRTIYPFPS